MMTDLLLRESPAPHDNPEIDNCEIEVLGDIDISSAPALRDRLVNLIDSGCRNLKLDIRRVEFLDTSGLGVLVGAMQRIRANGGSLELIGTSQRLLRIFSITGLDQAFGVPASARINASGN